MLQPHRRSQTPKGASDSGEGGRSKRKGEIKNVIEDEKKKKKKKECDRSENHSNPHVRKLSKTCSRLGSRI